MVKAEQSATTLPADDARHGTASAYIRYGCRCHPCRVANTERCRRGRRVAAAAGQCVECREKATAKHVRCAGCHERHLARYRVAKRVEVVL